MAAGAEGGHTWRCRRRSPPTRWTAPAFNGDGSLKSPARVTILHNGVLVQNNSELQGETLYIGAPTYKAHGPTPIKLQAHGDPSEPLSFRNIWVRELK